jgi:hypothetical protein
MLESIDQKGKKPVNSLSTELHGQSVAGKWAGSNPGDSYYAKHGKSLSLPFRRGKADRK